MWKNISTKKETLHKARLSGNQICNATVEVGGRFLKNMQMNVWADIKRCWNSYLDYINCKTQILLAEQGKK